MIVSFLIIAVGVGFGLGYAFALIDRTEGFTDDNPGPRTCFPDPYPAVSREVVLR